METGFFKSLKMAVTENNAQFGIFILGSDLDTASENARSVKKIITPHFSIISLKLIKFLLSCLYKYYYYKKFIMFKILRRNNVE